MDRPTSRLLYLLIAVGFFLHNFVFKLVFYPDVSLWLDEAYSVFNAQKSIPEIIELCKVDQNPPFYLILLHYWIKIAGISEEVGAQSMSLFFSSLTAPLLFFTVKRYWGINVALLATFFFTFADVHFYYSMEARAFALVSFLCVASYNLFFRAFEKNNYWLGIAIGLINGMAFFSHYIAVFIPITQFIISLFFLRKHKALFIAMVISGVVCIIPLIPWVQFIFGAMPEKGVYWLQPPGLRQLFGLFVSFFGGKLPLLFFVIVSGGWLFFNFKSLLIFKEWSSREKFKWITLIAWIIVPITLDYLISFKTPIFLNRYLMYVSFAFYILAADFIIGLPFGRRVQWGVAAVMLLLLGLSINTNLSKDENWRGALNYLKKTRHKKEVVVASAWYTNMVFSYYYDIEIFKQYNDNVELLKQEKVYFFNTMTGDDLAQIEPGERVFVVLCHWENVDPEHTITACIEMNYALVKEQEFEKVKVLEYVKN